MWPAISSQKKCYYKYMSAIRLIGLLENQTIRFTQPGLFNDPFEMPAMIAAQEAHDLWTSIYLPKLIGQTTGDILEHAMRRPFEINPRLLDFPATVIAGTFRSESVSPGDDSLTSEQAHDLAWFRLTEGEKREVDDRRSIIDRVREIDQTFGILSLTESYDNLLMWAHYADEHRGVVVEIETSDPAFLEPDPDRQDPREVRYSFSRPRLSVDDQVLLDVFFTKSPQWEYEREYRIVRRLEHATRIKPKPPIGFDLRLMSSMKDVDDIPTAGKNLFIVADATNGLHFRIFDGDGKLVVDTDETRLTEQARQIEDLRKQLEGLWPPHELTRSDKDRVITAVTSIAIVDHTRWKQLVKL